MTTHDTFDAPATAGACPRTDFGFGTATDDALDGQVVDFGFGFDGDSDDGWPAPGVVDPLLSPFYGAGGFGGEPVEAAPDVPISDEPVADEAGVPDGQGQGDAADDPGPAAADPAADAEPPAEPVRPAPSVDDVRKAAEEIAMLEALSGWVGDELKDAQKRHANLHADAVSAGMNRTIPLRLPNGVDIGTYNIAEGGRVLVMAENLLDLVAEHWPHNVAESIDGDRAIAYADVFAYAAMMHPDLVKRKVQPAFLTKLKADADPETGAVAVAETGEVVTVGTWVMTQSDGRGRCGWKRPKDAPTGREQLVMAWRSGAFQAQGALAGGISGGGE